MKKIVACMLALAMLALNAFSALAEEMDAQLRAVTALAKQRCGVSDRYTSFSGDSYVNGNGTYWYLQWSDGAGSVSITCDENGYPFNYYLDENSASSYDPYYAPHVPQYDLDKCRAAAETFLQAALRENESFRLEAGDKQLTVHDSGWVYLTGDILYYGLDTDTTFTIQIVPETMQVISFSRDDQWYTVANRDDAGAEVIDAQSAEDTLKGTIRMELEYVLDGENSAVLRYVPKADGEYTLRAVTGEMFDWSAARENIGMRYAMDADAGVAEMAAGGLTEAEIAGSEKLKGAMEKDALDAAVRAMTELGVTDEYTLRSVRYRAQDDRVTAYLQYAADAEDEAGYRTLMGMTEEDAKTAVGEMETTTVYRNVTLDAHTGALIACATWGNELPGAYSYVLAEIADLEAAKETAAEFLRKYAPDYAANLRAERADSLSGEAAYNPGVQVRLVRVENGVPFRQDGAVITVNVKTGFIDSYLLNWTEDEIAFEPTDGLIGEGAAYAAYCEAVHAKLCWHMLPVAYVDYEQQYDLALCYDLASEPEATAVGAKDGAIIAQEEADALYEYGDAVNEAAKALAEYGVGFPGGSFEADRLVTWREAAALLVELDGTHVWNEDDETILRCARNDRITLDAAALDSNVARGELIRALLTMSGYDRAAQVAGAFSSSFTDAETFGDDFGFYALAEAMDLAQADENGALSAQKPITRGEAAEMIWQFVNR